MSLVRERAAEVNRIQKVLEGANIKLASVASDVMGVAGRTMLAALAAGQEDACELAKLARGRLRAQLESRHNFAVQSGAEPAGICIAILLPQPFPLQRPVPGAVRALSDSAARLPAGTATDQGED